MDRGARPDWGDGDRLFVARLGIRWLLRKRYCMHDGNDNDGNYDSHRFILPPNVYHSYLISGRQKKRLFPRLISAYSITFGKINEHGFLLNLGRPQDAVFFIPLIYECSGWTGQNFLGRFRI